MNDHQFKLVAIGPAFAGKTALVRYYCTNITCENNIPGPTAGCSFLRKQILLDLRDLDVSEEGSDMIKKRDWGIRKIQLNCWDTCGQERYNSVTPMYYRDAQIVLCIYAINDKSSFDKLESVWIKNVQKEDLKCVGVIIGNKSDLDDERKVSREEGCALAKRLGYLFYETSANTGEQIREAIEKAIITYLTSPDLPFFEDSVGVDLSDIDRELQPTSQSCSC